MSARYSLRLRWSISAKRRRASIPCATHNSSTVLGMSAIASSSRAAAELRAVAVHVRHLHLVPPRDLLRADAQGGGQAAALLRARRVAALGDGGHHAVVQRR